MFGRTLLKYGSWHLSNNSILQFPWSSQFQLGNPLNDFIYIQILIKKVLKPFIILKFGLALGMNNQT